MPVHPSPDTVNLGPKAAEPQGARDISYMHQTRRADSPYECEEYQVTRSCRRVPHVISTRNHFDCSKHEQEEKEELPTAGRILQQLLTRGLHHGFDHQPTGKTNANFILLAYRVPERIHRLS